VMDGLEREGGRLIDRRCARTGGRIGLGTGMDRERGKAWDAVGHGRSSSCRDRAVRGSSRWFIEAPPGVKASGGRVLAWTRTGSSAGEFVLAVGLFCTYGGVGGAARERDAVERHALDAASEQLSLLGGEGAGVDAHPGDLRRQASVFDLRAAVHHHLEAVR